MRTPVFEDTITPALERIHLEEHHVVCYGYYGSQLLGTNVGSSDEDVLVIVDTPCKKTVHLPDNVDVRFVCVYTLEQEMRGFFDVWAVGAFTYPEHSHNGRLNPWAAYVKNFRPSAYQALYDFQHVTYTTRSSLRKAVNRGEPGERLRKLCRRVVKHEMVANKINDYVTSMFTTSDPTYIPLFTSADRGTLLVGTDKLYKQTIGSIEEAP
jgi:hypothetical protein